MAGSEIVDDRVFETTASPRAAYVHVPFCAHRCGYCNFTLVAGRDDLIESFLQAVEIELAQLGGATPVDTLYFGGGTPSQLSNDQLVRLANAVLAWHPLATGGEWTVEANPSDVTPELVAALAELGATRLSLGGQSFDQQKLVLLERDHSARQIARSVRLARGRGLAVALDLMFACPGETLDDWSRDLDAALELAPDHVSTYGLTFERGTRFWSRREQGELTEPDEQLGRAMYELAVDRLTSCGFEHYEVSNFGRAGYRSRHNQTYWSGDGYFAVGPGAARLVGGVRTTNHRSTTTYLRRVLAGQSPVAEQERLSRELYAREVLIFGLRRIAGVRRREFARRTGFEIDQLAAGAIERFVAMGLLYDDGTRVRLTRQGLLVSDALWPEFL